MQRARPEQLPPDGEWQTWFYLAGRGAGKTRTSSEWVARKAIQRPCRIAVVAPTFSDARDTCIEGESGLLAILKRYRVVDSWNRSQGALRTTNGTLIRCYSGEEPERLRGPQHDYAWVDELAAFKYPRQAWDQLKFGLRLGEHPQTVISTTPKPIPLVKELLSRTDGTVVVTRGSTFDNAKNLPQSVLDDFIKQYGGTRLGRQELMGEVLEDVEGALWTLTNIENNRVTETPKDIIRRVVAVDPAVTAHADSDETGIVIASEARNGTFYVEADHSMRGTPNEWAKRVIAAYDHYQCDAVVVETNQGGDMIANTLRTIAPNINVREVRATKGKALRAEPIAALYEQDRVHHVGVLELLETQMTTWTPADLVSPDRLDALVWALTELALKRAVAPVQTFRT